MGCGSVDIGFIAARTSQRSVDRSVAQSSMVSTFLGSYTEPPAAVVALSGVVADYTVQVGDTYFNALDKELYVWSEIQDGENVVEGWSEFRGPAGYNGINTAVIYLYKVSIDGTTAPSSFSGTFTYTFSSNALSGGTLNGWTTTVPTVSTGDYLWVSQAVASSTTDNDTIESTEFSSAVVMSATGAPGTNGNNTAVVTLYYKTSSSTTIPTATLEGTFTYTFATGALTGGTLNGWLTSMPAATSGEYIWVRQAAAVSSDATDIIDSTEFSSPVCISGVGSDGVDGVDGIDGIDGVDGVDGDNGPRGPGTFTTSAASSSGGYAVWSDTIADSACTDGPVINDIVVMTYENSLPVTKECTAVNDGAGTWASIVQYIDGSLLVAGSVMADSIRSNSIVTDALKVSTITNSGMTIDFVNGYIYIA
jgi:hypothetical protein